MKNFFRFLIAAALVFTGCDKSNDSPEPEPVPVPDFTVEQTALTQGSFSVRITPKDNENTYYFSVLTKKDYQSKYKETPETLEAAYSEWFGQMATQAGLSVEDFLKNALLSGMQNYRFRSLEPGTDYIFFVFGVDYSGKATTAADIVPFSTPKATLDKNVTFNITPTEVGSTWFKVKINCNDPDVYYYYDIMLPSIYEQYCGSNPSKIPEYVASYLSALKSENDTYAAMSEAQFISSITVGGEIEYDTALSEVANSLLPETEYPVFAIGIANDGSFTTDPTVVMVKTAETPKNDWKISGETLTDIQYNATVTPAYDEVYAVILERKSYFEGATDEQMVNDLLDARKGTFQNDLCVETSKVEFNNLIPDEDYYLFMIACTPDGLPKTGDKLNVKKHEVRTKTATPTGAVYSLKVFNIQKTSASVAVTVNEAGENQTFLTNYISKEELNKLTASMSEGEALKKHMDDLIDAKLKEWNGIYSTMDRKEFLSRLLPNESKTGSGNYIDLEGLKAGTTYYAYSIGLKADGTYTTEPFKAEFTTVEDVKSAVHLTSSGMKAWMYDEYYPNKTNYTLGVMADPFYQVGGAYGKSFTGTDEWADKSFTEIVEELKKEPAGAYGAVPLNLTVERGTKFYAYFVGVDKSGIPTDVIKITHTSKAEGSVNTGMGKEVSIDKIETIAR